MSSNIEQIIQRHVPRQYLGSREVAAVVRDLTAARDNAAANIRAAARRAGVSSQDVESVLIDSGLVERPTPPPAPAAAPAAPEDTRDGVVERLVEFARRHGFSG
jgi:hypothetical protein